MGIFDIFKKKRVTYTPPKAEMITVLMQDGTIEEYSENFYINDGKNCVVCDSGYYHLHFNCRNLKIERHSGKQVTGMDVREARKQHYELCPECKELDSWDF